MGDNLVPNGLSMVCKGPLFQVDMPQILVELVLQR
jgi:hypothetical protein